MVKNQNTSTKFQINSKFKISMTKTNCSEFENNGNVFEGVRSMYLLAPFGPSSWPKAALSLE